ncbi:putative membrane protein SirB2 [Pelomonas aquatica]|uniref:Membrane protein SirB2 n=1 Tax=Pelomonas aquatica TaxID=431058 RepID=A0ABU1Z5X1_9BURK|nr:SirB2 family protein [Pelomonas aquatica]MDR7295395.1 putative membrane protein SirB2 [Pelomonas aquatica]
MDYLTLKLVHQTAVALSITGFFIRGAASLAGASWVRSRAARTLPHLVDSVLLLSALMLAWTLRLTPDRAPWLLAKLLGLVVYVALGVVALRPGRPVAVRAAAWTGALAVVAWIASVAMTKSPWGFVAVLG